jgi:FAD synthetase
MKRVLVFGTFDVLHPGHIYFLRQAKRKGDWLIASVARDEYVRQTKRREPVHLQGERIEKLLETGLVDEAHLSDEDVGNYGVVSRAKPNVVCFGHDQSSLRSNFEGWLEERELSIATHVVSAFHPERYKSSIINPMKYRE